MNKSTKKNYKMLLLIILLILLGIAIGYATLSQRLTINGTATVDAEWKVVFKSIEVASSSGATQATSTPSKDSDTSVTFNVTLAEPGSYAEYTVIVENQGSIKAKLDSITDLTEINAKAPADVKYTITGPDIDSELDVSATHTYTVRVEWLSTSTEIPTETSKTATIELEYSQAQ